MASGNVVKYMSGVDSGWVELTGDTFTGKLRYRIIGPVFQVTNNGWIKLVESLQSGQQVLLATIPEGSSPPAFFGSAYWNQSPFPILAVKIEQGTIRLYNSSSLTITAGTNIMLNAVTMIN